MNPGLQFRTTILSFFGTMVLASTVLASAAMAVLPSPDGAYPGGNTAEGDHALFSLSTGVFNTAVGWYSQWAVTSGNYNTSVGAGALDLNTGGGNTATGTGALLLNTTGDQNTANGAFALFNNNTGSDNTAVGDGALYSNANAIGNTAVGFQALYSNATGLRNEANGYQALHNNTSGGNNTANGALALSSHISGDFNTAEGDAALYSDTTGFGNTAIGASALSNNTSGSGNIAVDTAAGINLSTGSVNIDIGNAGVAGESGTIRIGNSDNHVKAFISGIHGVNEGGTGILPVYINSDGQLGTTSSSRRFKKNIQPMDKATEAILLLKPVRFEYKDDTGGTPQFGLIAEDVAEVNPDLVVRDKNGDIYTVRYDAINAMLLNEFLKERRKVEEQQAAISELKSLVQQKGKEFQIAIAEQRQEFEARLRQQEAEIQKVNARIELNKGAPQTARE